MEMHNRVYLFMEMKKIYPLYLSDFGLRGKIGTMSINNRGFYDEKDILYYFYNIIFYNPYGRICDITEKFWICGEKK